MLIENDEHESGQHLFISKIKNAYGVEEILPANIPIVASIENMVNAKFLGLY